MATISLQHSHYKATLFGNSGSNAQAPLAAFSRNSDGTHINTTTTTTTKQNTSAESTAMLLSTNTKGLYNAFSRETVLTPPFDVALCEESSFINVSSNFLQKRLDLQLSGKPVGLSIGYHYTSRTKAESISYSGFDIKKSKRGHFGKGIYVGNNPHAFRVYGDVGLIVLVLQGKKQTRYASVNDDDRDEISVDSFLGNKTNCKAYSDVGTLAYFDELVLRSADQVLPLIRYPKKLINNADLMWNVHKWIIGFVLKHFYLTGLQPTPQRILPRSKDIQFEYILNSIGKNLLQTNPPSPPPPLLPLLPPKQFIGFEVCNSSSRQHHPFPGLSPDGSMVINLSCLDRCDGYPNNPTLIIEYSIPQGQERQDHPNPGRLFNGTKFVAFLPDLPESRRLLNRLKYAFVRGLTFRLYPGRPSSYVGLTSIPHKSGMTPGNGLASFWPDPYYFERANQTLDFLGVPAASTFP
jgi:deltex-like protein